MTYGLAEAPVGTVAALDSGLLEALTSAAELLPLALGLEVWKPVPLMPGVGYTELVLVSRTGVVVMLEVGDPGDMVIACDEYCVALLLALRELEESTAETLCELLGLKEIGLTEGEELRLLLPVKLAMAEWDIDAEHEPLPEDVSEVDCVDAVLIV